MGSDEPGDNKSSVDTHENLIPDIKSGVRIGLRVEYNGSSFSGWQKQGQPSLPTVQGYLESALSKIADSPVTVICAGRTDAGVHATSQIVHFDSAIDRGRKAWEQGTNSLLPGNVRVTEARAVAPDFHARFSARYRRYNYILHKRRFPSALIADQVTPCRVELDIDAMQQAAQYLLGEQDFTSFRAAGCQSKTANRCVTEVEFSRFGEFIVFSICANAFLQHMVRNIMGSLLVVGKGEQPPHWIESLLKARDRTQAAITAPPQGLYLVEVGYPENIEHPACLVKPPLLSALS